MARLTPGHARRLASSTYRASYGRRVDTDSYTVPLSTCHQTSTCTLNHPRPDVFYECTDEEMDEGNESDGYDSAASTRTETGSRTRRAFIIAKGENGFATRLASYMFSQ